MLVQIPEWSSQCLSLPKILKTTATMPITALATAIPVPISIASRPRQKLKDYKVQANKKAAQSRIEHPCLCRLILSAGSRLPDRDGGKTLIYNCGSLISAAANHFPD